LELAGSLNDIKTGLLFELRKLIRNTSVLDLYQEGGINIAIMNSLFDARGYRFEEQNLINNKEWNEKEWKKTKIDFHKSNWKFDKSITMHKNIATIQNLQDKTLFWKSVGIHTSASDSYRYKLVVRKSEGYKIMIKRKGSFETNGSDEVFLDVGMWLNPYDSYRIELKLMGPFLYMSNSSKRRYKLNGDGVTSLDSNYIIWDDSVASEKTSFCGIEYWYE
jgi:hypothetical protein